MLAERGQALFELGPLASGVQALAGQVQVPVMADLVAGGEDGGHRLRLMVSGMTWHVERRLDVVGGQQLENPAKSPGRPVLAERQHGQPAAVLLALAEPWCLAVNVEGQRDRDFGTTGPGRKSSRVAHAVHVLPSAARPAREGRPPGARQARPGSQARPGRGRPAR